MALSMSFDVLRQKDMNELIFIFYRCYLCSSTAKSQGVIMSFISLYIVGL
jgi:hypothetical protein